MEIGYVKSKSRYIHVGELFQDNLFVLEYE